MKAYYFETRVTNRKSAVVLAFNVKAAWEILRYEEEISLYLAKEDFNLAKARLLPFP